MTSDQVVEVMARAIFEESGTARLMSWERYKAFYHERGVVSPDYFAQARAAIRAHHAAGGLVLREVPGMKEPAHPDWPMTREKDHGWNAALAAVRALAVEVGE